MPFSPSPLRRACGRQRIRWTCESREGQYYAGQDARLALEGRREEEAHGEGEAVLHHAVREGSGCLAGEEIRKGHLVRALVYSTSKPVKNEEEDDEMDDETKASGGEGEGGEGEDEETINEEL